MTISNTTARLTTACHLLNAVRLQGDSDGRDQLAIELRDFLLERAELMGVPKWAVELLDILEKREV